MAGRKATIIYDDNGKPLYKNGGKNVVRVQFDKANNLYRLFENKKGICGRRSKAEIAFEFYRYTGEEGLVPRPAFFLGRFWSHKQGCGLKLNIQYSSLAIIIKSIAVQAFVEAHMKAKLTSDGGFSMLKLSKVLWVGSTHKVLWSGYNVAIQIKAYKVLFTYHSCLRVMV